MCRGVDSLRPRPTASSPNEDSMVQSLDAPLVARLMSPLIFMAREELRNVRVEHVIPVSEWSRTSLGKTIRQESNCSHWLAVERMWDGKHTPFH
jgi:hypothetical protein